MKLIYQGFKITPELKKKSKSQAVADDVNFNEWICEAMQEKLNRIESMKGAENENQEPKTNEL